MQKYIYIGSNVPMRCYNLPAVLFLLVILLASCRAKSQMISLSRAQKATCLDSFDYTITALPFALPLVPCYSVGEDVPAHQESAQGMRYRVTGHKLTQLADTSCEQQQFQARPSPPHPDIVYHKNWLVRVIGFLLFVLVMAIVLRVLRY